VFWVLFRKTYFPASSLRIAHSLVIEHAGRDPREGFHYPIYAILVPGKCRILTACRQAALVHLLHNGLLYLGVAKSPTVVAIKADLEFLIERVTRFRKEQALKPLYTMIGSAAIVIAWIELFWRHCL
jgi:hypothetical protein